MVVNADGRDDRSGNSSPSTHDMSAKQRQKSRLDDRQNPAAKFEEDYPAFNEFLRRKIHDIISQISGLKESTNERSEALEERVKSIEDNVANNIEPALVSLSEGMEIVFMSLMRFRNPAASVLLRKQLDNTRLSVSKGFQLLFELAFKNVFSKYNRTAESVEWFKFKKALDLHFSSYFRMEVVKGIVAYQGASVFKNLTRECLLAVGNTGRRSSAEGYSPILPHPDSSIFRVTSYIPGRAAERELPHLRRIPPKSDSKEGNTSGAETNDGDGYSGKGHLGEGESSEGDQEGSLHSGNKAYRTAGDYDHMYDGGEGEDQAYRGGDGGQAYGGGYGSGGRDEGHEGQSHGGGFGSGGRDGEGRGDQSYGSEGQGGQSHGGGDTGGKGCDEDLYADYEGNYDYEGDYDYNFEFEEGEDDRFETWSEKNAKEFLKRVQDDLVLYEQLRFFAPAFIWAYNELKCAILAETDKIVTATRWIESQEAIIRGYNAEPLPLEDLPPIKTPGDIRKFDLGTGSESRRQEYWSEFLYKFREKERVEAEKAAAAVKQKMPKGGKNQTLKKGDSSRHPRSNPASHSTAAPPPPHQPPPHQPPPHQSQGVRQKRSGSDDMSNESKTSRSSRPSKSRVTQAPVAGPSASTTSYDNFMPFYDQFDSTCPVHVIDHMKACFKENLSEADNTQVANAISQTFVNSQIRSAARERYNYQRTHDSFVSCKYNSTTLDSLE
ncbi:hypothetical protein SCHPADRAFT_947562 [Schizopora paradoxa]|uniref:Uncharacterized protein n=1 Tax=Schizopora paradoxa TaxID=27342 RepID=A0A0H2R056_9AGAM|nr:hypothetical protein SCHPADRAFT_947562 [Schizopora paradoxa]